MCGAPLASRRRPWLPSRGRGAPLALASCWPSRLPRGGGSAPPSLQTGSRGGYTPAARRCTLGAGRLRGGVDAARAALRSLPVVRLIGAEGRRRHGRAAHLLLKLRVVEPGRLLHRPGGHLGAATFRSGSSSRRGVGVGLSLLLCARGLVQSSRLEDALAELLNLVTHLLTRWSVTTVASLRTISTRYTIPTGCIVASLSTVASLRTIAAGCAVAASLRTVASGCIGVRRHAIPLLLLWLAVRITRL